ncbi:MAG: hypothetical protein ACK5VS_17225, partial [Hyphomonadaceae bacterium]
WPFATFLAHLNTRPKKLTTPQHPTPHPKSPGSSALAAAATWSSSTSSNAKHNPAHRHIGDQIIAGRHDRACANTTAAHRQMYPHLAICRPRA